MLSAKGFEKKKISEDGRERKILSGNLYCLGLYSSLYSDDEINCLILAF